MHKEMKAKSNFGAKEKTNFPISSVLQIFLAGIECQKYTRQFDIMNKLFS